MTKSEFTSNLNTIHKTGSESEAITFLMLTTRLGEKLCKTIIRNLWNCSNPKYVGQNILQLLEVSASDNTESEFKPKIKKGCSIYIIYPDEHAAIFALFKLKQYNNEGITT